MAQTDFTNAEDAQTQVFNAEDSTIKLENSDFISSADMSRDGFDLTLTLDNGESVIVEGYFASNNPPTIMSEGGLALTPQLVNSFVSSDQFAQAGSETDVSPVGAVKEISGEATVTRTDGTVEEINLGTPIYEGDIVETTADGAVNIIFIDETEFAVSEDARLAIDEYVFDADTAEGTTNFSILRGVFVFTSGIIGRDDPDDVEIETPVGSIGIRGTIIAGHIDPNGVDSQITVIEGAIVVRNGLGETTLSNQFETVQLTSYESDIVNMGTLDAVQMNQNFGSVSGVSASLFSAINDTSYETDPGEPLVETQEDAPIEEELDSQGGNMSDEHSDGTTDGEGAQLDTSLATKTVLSQTDTVTNKSGLESTLTNSNTGISTTTSAKTTTSTVKDTVVSKTTTAVESNTTTSATTTNTSSQLESTNFDSSTQGTDILGLGDTSENRIFNIGDSAVFSSKGFDIPTVTGANIGTSIAALGDINGDGRSEFVFTGTSGEYFIYDTTLSVVVDTWIAGHVPGDVSTGLNVAAGGDINADGSFDLIVGMPNADGPTTLTGNISTFSGVNSGDNSHIVNDNAFVATSPGTVIGTDVVLLGDINADGYSDYATGFDENANGDGGILIKLGANNSFAGNSDTVNFDYIPAGPGELLGQSLHNAGDLNNDGFSDLVAGTVTGDAYVIYGAAGGLGTFTSVSAAITAPAIAGITQFGKNVVGGSDVNRDGHSDLLITSIHSTHGEMVHLYSGDNLTSVKSTFLTTRTGWEVTAGTMLGDTNGDGIDDFALTTSNGVDSETFLIYGRDAGLPAQVDLNFNNLTTFNPTLGEVFVWDGSGSEIELGSIGDVNGDGLYDLAIGASQINSDGAVKVVFGTALPNVIQDGDVGDTNPNIGDITASANGQALLGDDQANVIRSGIFSNISISAGNGDDLIELNVSPGVTHKTIHGGGGDDHLILTGSSSVLDFTNTGAPGMSISAVERITLNGNSQTLQFDISDIFDLLREADGNTLQIDAIGTGNTLQIVRDGTDIFLGAEGFSGTNGDLTAGSDDNANGFFDLQFGGYTLLIDTDIAVGI